jgi:hypothetical protein
MPTWLVVVGGAIAVLVGISTLTLVVRGAWKDGKIEELRADMNDAEERDDRRVKEIREVRDRETALELRVHDLERDKEVLIEAATHAGKIEALLMEFIAHRKAVQKRQGDILSKEDLILAAIKQVADSIDRLITLVGRQ